MTVVHINTSAAWGGLEQYTIFLVEQQQSHQVDSELICRVDTPLHVAAVNAGIPVRTVRGGGHVNLECIRILRHAKYSKRVVHAHTGTDVWAASLSAMYTNNPIVFHAHMVPSAKNDRIHRWLYKRVSTVVTPSNTHAAIIPDNYPVSKDQVKVIRHARKVELYAHTQAEQHDLRKLHGIKNSDFVLGYFGRIDKQKGMVELVQAMSLLNTNTLANTKLFIIGDASCATIRGEKTIEKKALEVERWMHDYISTSNLGDKVIRVPHSDTGNLLFPLIDVAILPSYREMFSLSVLEAMLSGKPVIGTNSGGTPEQLQDGRGILVPPKSPKAIAEAIEEYYRDEELRNKHAQNGYAWALKNCDPAVIMEQYNSLYKELLEKVT
ncbi:MAG: glycosyltransferase family 4 protein [Ignavibacteria bacterium]|nr:glycosyltransferase family 4 protein [Ignavibacteria bacterium]